MFKQWKEANQHQKLNGNKKIVGNKSTLAFSPITFEGWFLLIPGQIHFQLTVHDGVSLIQLLNLIERFLNIAMIHIIHFTSARIKHVNLFMNTGDWITQKMLTLLHMILVLCKDSSLATTWIMCSICAPTWATFEAMREFFRLAFIICSFLVCINVHSYCTFQASRSSNLASMLVQSIPDSVTNRSILLFKAWRPASFQPFQMYQNHMLLMHSPRNYF